MKVSQHRLNDLVSLYINLLEFAHVLYCLSVQVSLDMNIIDLEVAMKLSVAVGTTMNAYSILLVMIYLTWPLVFLIIPTLYATYRFQVIH